MCPTGKDYLGTHFIAWLLGLARFESGKKITVVPRSSGSLANPDSKAMAAWPIQRTVEEVAEAVEQKAEHSRVMEIVRGQNYDIRPMNGQVMTFVLRSRDVGRDISSEIQHHHEHYRRSENNVCFMCGGDHMARHCSLSHSN